jgi:hypothetical protein
MAKLIPYPKFDTVSPEQVLKASIWLFYGGNKVTEFFGNHVYKHPFWPAAFHAAGGLGGAEMLNIGIEATIKDVRKEYQETRRIDVIELLDLTDFERDIICRKFRRDAGNNIYDAGGYARMGSKFWVLRFLKNIHASDKNDFCSDNVVDNFSEPPLRRKGEADEEYNSLLLPRKIEVSYLSSEDTAPWHLLEHAIDKNFQNGTRRIRTVHIGPDFLAAQKKKFPELT